MEMKIIPANGGGPGMNGVFLSGYGDGDYTPRPRSGPLSSLIYINFCCFFFNYFHLRVQNHKFLKNLITLCQCGSQLNNLVVWILD